MDAPEPQVVTVVCAWCGRLIRGSPDATIRGKRGRPSVVPVSHGICPSCFERARAPLGETACSRAAPAP